MHYSVVLSKPRLLWLLRKLYQARCFTSNVTKEDKDVVETDATLYVHWPYCARKCTYCNYNKYISKSVDNTRMSDCLSMETRTLLELSGISRITTVFFGGGTPSLSPPSTVGKVIDTIRDHAILTEGSEVTLEANPTLLETSKLRDFQIAGVNRLSIGVQALSSEDLKFLGREHSVTEALRCVEKAKKIFPDRVSVDLMFGRPGQTLESWMKELKQVISMDVNHVSLYQLTVERGTPLFKWVDSGQVMVPDNDTMADMYTQAVKILEAHGLERYEVSNFARKGYECQHNQAYWQGSQYIGVGPGAHGRFAPLNKPHQGGQLCREARVQTPAPENWMYEVEKFGHATRKIVPLSTKDRLEELLISSLRTREGLSCETWSKVGDRRLFSALVSSETFCHFVSDGFLNVDHSGIRASSSGILVLDSILPHLLYTLAQVCEKNGIT